jgi:uncharacterized membrane protein YfcA
MNEILFYIVILLANIIQGITGFAGTILAMPFSLKLVGMDVAVPVLNFLGIASGIYVLAGNYRHVDRKELLRAVAVMEPAVIIGLIARRFLSGKPQLLYYVLGAIVLALAVSGLWGLLRKEKRQRAESDHSEQQSAGPKNDLRQSAEAKNVSASSGAAALDIAMLAASGLVHGLFVCGGPLLIGYLSKRIKNKASFRATISTIWILLNGTIFVSQLISGAWNTGLIKVQLISLPFMAAGMFAGSLLYKRLSQRTFMLITYVLLFIAGLTLFFK